MERDIFIRKAKRSDMKEIKALITSFNLDVAKLSYDQFVICKSFDIMPDGSYQESRIVGCGRLKPLGSDLYELASLAVSPDYQRRKIGTNLVSVLIQEYPDGMPCRADKMPLLRGVWAVCERKDYVFFKKHQFFECRPIFWPKSLDLKVNACKETWGETEIVVCHHGTTSS